MISIGSDHAGFELKEILRHYLEEKGLAYHDYGTYSADSADYADFAHPVAASVNSGAVERGILVCGSGQGVCMTANKYSNVRAALVWNAEVAQLTREHNDANILCLPGRMIDPEEAKRAVDAFLNTKFEGGRHQRRIDKIPC